ncbi:MAG: M48 family metalloprotease [Gammaproteobacteria bacterium]|nr:M48 family metallopeptidase [Rhodocyclaceae bacterium]MBU3910506.1 M48 family metalloprotease [Gammaproteobacteria bacterium]MBU3989592.1 M48 family metalloprotease [Gammaproteobacteria bacterium]MBU4004987.1 M48 family metalloprotease [Gammaproteobacteria bacterium]MBU4020580.1 M48 family metalloprotease [Gammaproteobacteria bacterium]
MKSFLWLILAGFLLLPGVLVRADGLPDLGESDRAALSPQAERRLGEQIMQEIRRDPAYLDDPEVAGYVSRLGQRLASHAEGTRPSFEFFVIKDSMLNAFALPGGYIGVHTGLILAARAESELAAVLAHEISHVTQSHLARLFGKQSQAQLAALLSMAVAILAARSNPDVAIGAALSGQAAGIQQQLNFSRDFEREADRLGLNMLDQAGYDTRGMATFFERMLQFGRLYENNAPGYLRTHPLTTERISDMENRIAQRPYRQVPDSVEFGLVRAKLQAQNGTPGEAVADFTTQLKSGKYSRESDVRFGYAHALLRDNKVAEAEREVAALRRLKLESPLLESLTAQLQLKRRDSASALQTLRAAVQRYPHARALVYALIEAQIGGGEASAALALTQKELQLAPRDSRLHALQAKTFAALGKRLQQHRAQAEAYLVDGLLIPAIEQLELARKADDGDFYALSQVDARLRELKQRRLEELRRDRRQREF